MNLHKLALQEFFDAWKEATLRNHISCVLDEDGRSKEIKLTEAETDIMKIEGYDPRSIADNNVVPF